MADKKDSDQKAQADLELADKEAEEVKGGMAYGKKSRKRKKGASAGGGSASAKPM